MKARENSTPRRLGRRFWTKSLATSCFGLSTVEFVSDSSQNGSDFRPFNFRLTEADFEIKLLVWISVLVRERLTIRYHTWAHVLASCFPCIIAVETLRGNLFSQAT